MKKFICLFPLLLLLAFTGLSQKQGLGLLPTQGVIKLTQSGLNSGSKTLRSICVNGDLPSPGRGDIYRFVEDGGNINFKVNGKDYPGGFKKAVDDEIIFLEPQGFSEVGIRINPKKSDIQDIEIEVAKGGTVLHPSGGNVTKNNFKRIAENIPESTDDQFEYWRISKEIDQLEKTGYLKNSGDFKIEFTKASDAFRNDFPERSLREVGNTFENLNKLGYIQRSDDIKNRLGNAEDAFKRDFPDRDLDEITSKHELYTKLGYTKNSGDAKTNFLESENAFIKDFGTDAEYSLNQYVKGIENFNTETAQGYPVIYIQKSASTGKYIAFDKLDRPIFSGEQEADIIKAIEGRMNDNDNVYLSMRGFETPEKESAFVSTLNIKSKTGGAKNVYFNKLDAGGLSLGNRFISNRYQHKLLKEINKNEITMADYNGKSYFRGEARLESKIKDDPWSGEDVTHIEALAVKKDILENLLDDISTTFKSFSENLSLGVYFNRFKKELKKTQGIQSEDEFIIKIKSEFRDFRIVKVTGENELQIRSN